MIRKPGDWRRAVLSIWRHRSPDIGARTRRKGASCIVLSVRFPVLFVLLRLLICPFSRAGSRDRNRRRFLRASCCRACCVTLVDSSGSARRHDLHLPGWHVPVRCAIRRHGCRIQVVACRFPDGHASIAAPARTCTIDARRVADRGSGRRFGHADGGAGSRSSRSSVDGIQRRGHRAASEPAAPGSPAHHPWRRGRRATGAAERSPRSSCAAARATTRRSCSTAFRSTSLAARSISAASRPRISNASKSFVAPNRRCSDRMPWPASCRCSRRRAPGRSAECRRDGRRRDLRHRTRDGQRRRPRGQSRLLRRRGALQHEQRRIEQRVRQHHALRNSRRRRCPRPPRCASPAARSSARSARLVRQRSDAPTSTPFFQRHNGVGGVSFSQQLTPSLHAARDIRARGFAPDVDQSRCSIRRTRRRSRAARRRSSSSTSPTTATTSCAATTRPTRPTGGFRDASARSGTHLLTAALDWDGERATAQRSAGRHVHPALPATTSAGRSRIRRCGRAYS